MPIEAQCGGGGRSLFVCRSVHYIDRIIMLRGTIRCFRTVASKVHTRPTTVDAIPWVGCSHWTTPYRPHQSFSTHRSQGDGLFDPPELAQDGDTRLETTSQIEDDEFMDLDESQEGIIIDQIDPHDDATHSPDQTIPTRPTLPTSIKKLNRLLSHSRNTAIPESDLIEKFVKGRGPGGQAINKTNSSVSLIHIPTGIRIQSQPTRSREENRKIARKILGEKLDLIRARSGQDAIASGSDAGGNEDASGGGTEAEKGGSRKDKERVLAKQFSRDEIRWEKERRRKSNKAKKAKKKHGPGSGGAESDGGSGIGEGQS
jgi:protein subunit release factor B